MTLRPKTATPEVPARRRTWFRLPYIILALVMALFAYKFIEKDRQIHSLQAQAAALMASNAATDRTNAAIQHALPYYQSPAYVAEQARSILGYRFPGDIVVQTVPRYQAAPQMRQAPRPLAPPPQPSWRQWWIAFFG